MTHLLILQLLENNDINYRLQISPYGQVTIYLSPTGPPYIQMYVDQTKILIESQRCHLDNRPDNRPDNRKKHTATFDLTNPTAPEQIINHIHELNFDKYQQPCKIRVEEIETHIHQGYFNAWEPEEPRWVINKRF